MATPWKTWKTWKTMGITADPQPALRCGVESEDQGRPSHFPWLFLGRSFDLFLRKAAETQRIESWCLAVMGPGGSARLLLPQKWLQDVTTPSPPAPPAPARREGESGPGEKGRSSRQLQALPWPASPAASLGCFVLMPLGKDAFVFSSPVVVSLGAPHSSSFVWEQKTLPRPKAGREILEQAVNLCSQPSDTHLLLHSWERGKGKLAMGFFSAFLIKLA